MSQWVLVCLSVNCRKHIYTRSTLSGKHVFFCISTVKSRLKVKSCISGKNFKVVKNSEKNWENIYTVIWSTVKVSTQTYWRFKRNKKNHRIILFRRFFITAPIPPIALGLNIYLWSYRVSYSLIFFPRTFWWIKKYYPWCKKCSQLLTAEMKKKNIGTKKTINKQLLHILA